jgi:hypothetical protein
MLAYLCENQAERNIERILMETIIEMTYALRILTSKEKFLLFPHFKKRKEKFHPR